MEPHGLGKPTEPGRSGSDNRCFVEAVLWIAHTGLLWRDLPGSFGQWNTVFKRPRDWVKAEVFMRLFETCSDDPDRGTPWSTPPSSRSTAMARAQRGTHANGIRS
ncbi:MAG: transposase [Defluviicoccus sp.]|nr:MAG: transposase [Defluviicoccus sp.]